MTFTVRFTPEAKDDLLRLYSFLLEKDLLAAEDALRAMTKGVEFLRDFPFSCRKALPDNPFLRELLIPFGNSGFVALFEIQEERMVTILAVRHQREDDYY
ncbi:MAG: type II toxin-antitoxin system RelE/ParE family toxin [Chlorobiaceae bacterium]|nr:type II toxin-antitoxin system RelE/ParE family toxin [Chlorobiaceae bacterium]